MNFNKFMSTIPIRGDILDDITYLQKHLRLVIKYHQVSVVSLCTYCCYAD